MDGWKGHMIRTEGRYKRPRTPMAAPAGVFARTRVDGPVEVTAMGFVDSHTFHADPNVEISTRDRLDRAVLVQSVEHWRDIREEFRSKCLRTPLPEVIAGGGFGENLLVSGCSADDLCVGDKLMVARRAREGGGVDDGDDDNNALVLQITSPRRPCSRVNMQFGATWDGSGVRAYCARTGRAGFMCRVLTPGVLPDGCALAVVERPHPRWTLARVSSLIYGMEGACDKPQYYALPGFGYKTPSGVYGTGGGREAVLSEWKATEDDMRELAGMEELACYEWRDEVRAMLGEVDQPTCWGAWSRADRKSGWSRFCNGVRRI
jgi:MOSC domain-containing protein YiiM